MKKIVLLTLVIGLITPLKLAAQEAESDSALKFLLGASFEFGGDEVAEVLFTNGDDQSVFAGQGGSIHAGLQYQIPNVDKLLLRTTIGYKYVTTAADNANITLTRIPVHATANWKFTDDIRLGAGLVLHQNVKFDADGLGDNIKFDNATGVMFELAYRWFGVSYTNMEYQAGNDTYDASSIGFNFYGTF